MGHLSVGDCRHCSESLELDDACSSLADILDGSLQRTEGDSFCVISCMLHEEKGNQRLSARCRGYHTTDDTTHAPQAP